MSGFTFPQLVKRFNEWYAMDHRPASVTTTRYTLKHALAFFQETPVDAIKPLDVEDFKQHLIQMGMLPGTVKQKLDVLRHLFQKACEWEMIDKNPMRWMKGMHVEPTKHRVLTVEEEARLLMACHPPIRPLVVVALQTGLRKGELETLTWENVNLEERILTIESRYSKNRKEGIVPLNEVAVSTLRSIRPTLAVGRVFGYINIGNSFRYVTKRAGLPDVTPHTLRHTFASRLVIAGVPIAFVQQLLRHASIVMTLRYTHLNIDHLRGALDTLQQHQAKEVRKRGAR